jgi:hypothetical protein
MKDLRRSGDTWREAAEKLRVSLSNGFHWANYTLEPIGREHFQTPRRFGPKCHLEKHEEKNVIEEFRRVRRRYEALTLETVIKIVDCMTKNSPRPFRPSRSWASRFMGKHNWSCHHSRRRTAKELRPTMETEVKQFIDGVNKTVSDFGLDDSAIWAFDESSIESGGIPPNTFVDPETNDNSVLETCPPRRDTLVLAVNASGEKYHEFIEHCPAHIDPITRQKVPAVKGLHTVHMAPFIRGVYTKTSGEAALMIQDNLRAHHNPEVITTWTDNNISPQFLPPQSAKYASVLDRSLFSVTKSRLRNIPFITIEEKRAAADQVVNSLEHKMIKKMWRKCGYYLKDGSHLPPGN